jgi:hypothetical protein
MRPILIAAFLVALSPELVRATSLEQSLTKLDPEERSHQACALKALPILRRDKRIAKADHLKSSIFSRAILKGTSLVAAGGAVKSAGQWFSISYTCELTPDYMKANAFTYTLGTVIPKDQWEKMGLWG